MLTSLRLVDFKNFRDETLRMGPLTVIVGANASGKSNLRDAFRLLHGIKLRPPGPRQHPAQPPTPRKGLRRSPPQASVAPSIHGQAGSLAILLTADPPEESVSDIDAERRFGPSW